MTNGKPDNDSELRTVSITSSLDGTEQKSLFYVPKEGAPDKKGEPVPLLVMLHTWSGDYTKIKSCPKEQKWVMIAPDFRGPNTRPEACASKLAIQDVLDAVEYAKKNARIDESRIYLCGWSGGGHMSLMMTAKAPNIWAGVSTWVPISDLAAWHASGKYMKQMEGLCGGAPGTPATDAEYKARSPIHFLPAAKGVPMDINAGIHDGHEGSVPISQSLNAFNVLAEANGLKDKQIPAADIEFMTRTEKVPEALAGESENDSERNREVLFRRVAGPVRITIFEGGHEAEVNAAWNCLARQKKGSPANFEVPKSAVKAKKETGEAQQVDK
ncbi:MAG: prolyl oligopeptidase family serine peptidase [Victivallales bacterium]